VIGPILREDAAGAAAAPAGDSLPAEATARAGPHARWSSLVSRWEAYWFRPIPPHSYALLRIAFGALGLLTLVGLTPVDLFWPLDGITPVAETGMRGAIADAGLGTILGWVAFGLLVAAFTAMTVGYNSDVAVLLCLVGVILQHHWNRFPLSSAHVVMVDVLFCLVWTQTGRVWSVDAIWKRRRGLDADADAAGLPIWPLRLLMYQVAVIYGCSGLWKFMYGGWRDGQAVHWSVNLNAFHRLPWPLPAEAGLLLAGLTWFTLFFELAFPVLVVFRRTRPLALILGVLLHVGLLLMLELGPFSYLMIASYIAFLDPYKTEQRVARFTSLHPIATLFSKRRIEPRSLRR
jgi:hypothetical protein